MRAIRAIIWLFVAIMLIICLLCVTVVIVLFSANETGITDESAYRLINNHFGINVSEGTTVIYKDYGTNIREEFFTIIIQCTDQRIVEKYIETADSYIPACRVLNSASFEKQLPPGVDGFYCLYQWDESGRWTHRVLVADDKRTIIFILTDNSVPFLDARFTNICKFRAGAV